MRQCEREKMKESVRWKDRERAGKREGGTDKERECSKQKVH